MENFLHPMFTTAIIVGILTFAVTLAIPLIGRASIFVISYFSSRFRQSGIYKRFFSRVLDKTSEVESKCSNPNCIRCLNAVFRGKELLGRLRAYAEYNNLKSELQRLEASLTGSYQLSEPTDSSSDNRKSIGKSVQKRDLKVHPSELMSQKLNLQQPTVLYVPGLRAVPWHDGLGGHNKFKNDILLLERPSNLEVITEEFETVVASDTGWSKNQSDEGKWELFYFFNQGKPIQENSVRCPRTLEIIRHLKNFMEGSVFGNACFSVIHPGTHIGRHTGPTNCRLRCHLLLRGGKDCSLEVASMSRSWPEGRTLVFDDSFPHSVTHSGAKIRCVLLVDFWHPDLTKAEIDCLRSMFMT